MRHYRAFACVGLILLMSAVAAAQEEHQHHHPPGEQIGKVVFPTSCSPQAQLEFTRAVAWLHSFEYEEASRAFQQVAQTDSSCGMAHWGVAMSLYHQLWAPPSRDELARGRAAAEKARSVGARGAREREYIDAINTFYRDSERLDHPTRAAAYERAMESIYSRYRADSEAAVFYALALNASAMAATPFDKTYAKQKKAAAILNGVLRRQPRHPGVAHYLIHSYDYPQLARLALSAARQYSKIAPSSAHALHMPSHIFTRLGLWDDSIAMNIRSQDAARGFASRYKLTGVWDDQLHAMDYLAYAYLQRARDKEALAVLTELRTIRKTEPESFKCAYTFAAIPARWTLERRKWSDAAELTVQPDNFPWNRFRAYEAITWFARAIGAARSGKIDQARADTQKLKSLHEGLIGIKDNYDWATQVAIQHKSAAAWLAKAEGRNDDALRLMQEAADLEDSTDKHPVTPSPVLPQRELFGEMLLELNRPVEALRQFERSLTDSPNRFNGLFGAARAAERAGQAKVARAYYQKLVTTATGSERPEIKEAREFLASQ